MTSRFATVWILSLAAGLAVACASKPDRVAEDMGNAMASLRERQTANPDASEELVPVEGLGATTAQDVVTNYHENQRTEAQQERQERQRDNGLVDIDN